MIRTFNTIKYLKLSQIFYRLYYIFKKKICKFFSIKTMFVKKSNTVLLSLTKPINSHTSYLNGSFNFLNLSYNFSNNIDWNFAKYGKLWTYNLNYFNFLNQKEIDKQDAIGLIYDFIDKIQTSKDGLEPFPISLRGINWIKFLIKNNIQDSKINDSLYAQYDMLFKNLEFHLLGNHLLENAFSLLFAAFYFNDDRFYKSAKNILIQEFNNQILKDGGHFEQSPMYHQIMLERTLDCINLLKNNKNKDGNLLNFLVQNAQKMLGWLEQITYKDGSIPLVNDSANNTAPTSNELFEYAKLLEVNIEIQPLSDSGYRKINFHNYECFVDVGDVAASYIAGHTHADSLNFELRVFGKPFIVDCGISTYDTNLQREFERSSAAHNCVVLNGTNSSDVWGSFRVANRAKIISLSEGLNFIEASHNGYEHFGVICKRRFEFENDKIIITDELTKDVSAKSFLHFDKDVYLFMDKIKIINGTYKISSYKQAGNYNILYDAQVLEIDFVKNCQIWIYI